MIALFEDTPVYFLASISRSSEVLPKDEERFLFNRCQRRTKRYSQLFLTSNPPPLPLPLLVALAAVQLQMQKSAQ